MLAGRIYDKTGFVMPVGSILPYAGKDAPEGWLLCDGSTYKKADYPDLYAVIGETYSLGSGSETQFSLPDLKARFPVGISGNDALGATGGAKEVQLQKGNLPSHRHRVRGSIGGGSHFHEVVFGDGGGYGNCIDGTHRYREDKRLITQKREDGVHSHPIDIATEVDGGVKTPDPIENRPPYLALNYIIKY
jgi:microcystin-dependent protein